MSVSMVEEAPHRPHTICDISTLSLAPAVAEVVAETGRDGMVGMYDMNFAQLCGEDPTVRQFFDYLLQKRNQWFI